MSPDPMSPDPQISRKKFLGGAVALGAGLSALGSPGAIASTNLIHRTSASRGTLRLDLAIDSSNFNGLNGNNQFNRWPIDPVQETLYRLDANLNPIPWLAQGMPRRLDDLHHQVTIKNGIRFHNGDLLTAEHVAATFNAAKETGRVWRAHLVSLDSVTVINPRTVQFNLNKVFAPLLDKMTVIPIMHRDYLTRPTDVMGTGPFRWGEYSTGSHIRLDANPRYRLGAPGVQQIVFSFVPDAGARTVNLLQGKSDILPLPPYSSVPALKRRSGITVVNFPAPINSVLRMNWTSRQFKDGRLRKALLHALDRQRIVDVGFGGLARPGQGPVGPPVEGSQYARRIYAHRPNVAKAKSLLQQAGVSNLTFEYMCVNDENVRNIALIAQESWKDAGITANLTFLELPSWLQRFGRGDFEVATIFSVDGIASGRSADLITLPLESGNPINTDHVVNRQLNNFIVKARQTFDDKARARIYGQVTNVCAIYGARPAPVYAQFVLAQRNGVRGLAPAPLQVCALDLYKVTVP